MTLSSLRRLCNLFDQFEDCRGFKKQLVGKGKGETKLLVISGKKGTMVYNAKEEISRAKSFMDTGIRIGLVRISPQWIDDARLNHRVTTNSLIPHRQKPALDLINFSKNCDLSNFSQFLEKSQKLRKSQFLLSTFLPPVTLDLINFGKNCDLSNFSQFLEKLKKSQFLLDSTPLPPTLDLILAKTLISPIFCNFWRNCRNRSFCWAPLYLLYHLNSVILANLRFLQFFAIFATACKIGHTELSQFPRSAQTSIYVSHQLLTKFFFFFFS